MRPLRAIEVPPATPLRQAHSCAFCFNAHAISSSFKTLACRHLAPHKACLSFGTWHHSRCAQASKRCANEALALHTWHHSWCASAFTSCAKQALCSAYVAPLLVCLSIYQLCKQDFTTLAWDSRNSESKPPRKRQTLE